MAIDPRRQEARRRHINPTLGMDAPATPDAFAVRVKGATTLAKALDDGYPEVDRYELIGKNVLIVKWEIKPGYGGRDYAKVWMMFQDGDDVTQCKIRDGGSDIVEALTEAQKNGTRGNVFVKFDAEEYGFESPGGPFLKYVLRDPDAIEESEGTGDVGNDDPDF